MSERRIGVAEAGDGWLPGFSDSARPSFFAALRMTDWFEDTLVPMFVPAEKNDPELYPYRNGLYFAFCNALNWQVATGAPTVLFLE